MFPREVISKLRYLGVCWEAQGAAPDMCKGPEESGASGIEPAQVQLERWWAWAQQRPDGHRGGS